MRRATFVRLVLPAVPAFVAGPLPAFGADRQTAPALAGSLYKLAAGDKNSVAVAAAAVYLHPVTSTDPNQWIGPNLTDAFGRFTFSNLAPGQYLLRIYSGTIHLWEQTVQLPAKLEPIVVRDVRVVYYPKASDGPSIDAILAKLPLPTDRTTPVNTLPTNTLWFGDRVALSDVKLVAKALVSGGVALRAVQHFATGDDWRAKVIEIGASPDHVSDPVLTAAAIDAAKDFPRAR